MSRWVVYVTPAAWAEVKDLPGHVRERLRRALQALADDPRPSQSKTLTVPGVAVEARRLRLDRWRIVYTVGRAEGAESGTVDVLAVRKRPPYDYGDLARLLGPAAGHS